MPKKTKNIKYAILNFGYAESGSVGSIVLLNKGPGFTSDKEAEKALANNLLALYKYDENIRDTKRDCCAAANKKKFCPDCGRPIEAEELDAEHFQEWMQDLLTATNDSIGGMTSELEGTNVWELGYSASWLVGSTEAEIINFEEYADREICKILGLK